MAMNGRSRWLGIVVVGVIFVTGAVAGIAADRILRPALLEGRGGQVTGPVPEARGLPRRPGAPPRGNGLARIPRGDAARIPMLEQLDLSPVQREQVDSILERRRRQVTTLWRDQEATFRAAMDSTQEEVLSVLTPEQRAEYRERIRDARTRWQERPGGVRERRLPGAPRGSP